jgi:hypothetical protein
MALIAQCPAQMSQQAERTKEIQCNPERRAGVHCTEGTTNPPIVRVDQIEHGIAVAFEHEEL